MDPSAVSSTSLGPNGAQAGNSRPSSFVVRGPPTANGPTQVWSPNPEEVERRLSSINLDPATAAPIPAHQPHELSLDALIDEEDRDAAKNYECAVCYR